MKTKNPVRYDELKLIFGERLSPDIDGFEMLKMAAEKEHKSDMYLCCGTEDGLFDLNIAFRDKAAELGFNPTWSQKSGGHTLEYTNEVLPDILNWFPLKKL